MDSIICPYCNYELDDDAVSELNHHGKDIMCPNCDEWFHAWCETTIEYHVRRI